MVLRSGQNATTTAKDKGKHTFLTAVQSVMLGSASSEESVPETRATMSCWTSSRSGEEMRTTMREVVLSDTPYRRMASLIYKTKIYHEFKEIKPTT